MLVRILVILISVAAMQSAHADNVRVALVVGSNPGGPGQKELRFAESDAKRFSKTLQQVGGFADTKVLLSPSPEVLDHELAAVAKRLAYLKSQGHETTLLIYYSGHATASGLNLGSDEYRLDRLRNKLKDMPSDLLITVLDACQSGAMTRAKGAAAAEDFSIASTSLLNLKGAVTLASSASNEFSQESDELRASYFTHFFLVALMGAADQDNNKRVSLSEAYNFVYHQTLSATARSRLGRQHPVMQTDIAGRGDLVLATLSKQDRQLVLPRSLSATVLVENAKTKQVVAELMKAPTRENRLHLAPAAYTVVVRTASQTRECAVDLTNRPSYILDSSRCRKVRRRASTSKGLDFTRKLWIESSVGLLSTQGSPYTERLFDFGYSEYDGVNITTPSVSVSVLLNRYLAAGVEYTNFDSGNVYRKRRDLDGQRFIWSSSGVGLFSRFVLTRQNGYGLVDAYVGAGGGVGLGRSRLTDESLNMSWGETSVGYYLQAHAGLNVNPFFWADSIFKHLTFTHQFGISHAPLLENEFGETHDSGGLSFRWGMGLTF